MITVYRLRDQADHIKRVQKATRETNAFGIQQTHGLFGSDAWWQQIASGALPLHTARGHITRVFMGSMGDWPEFTMTCLDGTERTETRWLNTPELDALFKLGVPVELDYVVQYSRDSTPNDCVIAIRVGDRADAIGIAKARAMAERNALVPHAMATLTVDTPISRQAPGIPLHAGYRPMVRRVDASSWYTFVMTDGMQTIEVGETASVAIYFLNPEGARIDFPQGAKTVFGNGLEVHGRFVLERWLDP